MSVFNPYIAKKYVDTPPVRVKLSTNQNINFNIVIDRLQQMSTGDRKFVNQHSLFLPLNNAQYDCLYKNVFLDPYLLAIKRNSLYKDKIIYGLPEFQWYIQNKKQIVLRTNTLNGSTLSDFVSLDFCDYERPNDTPSIFQTQIYTNNDNMCTYTIDDAICSYLNMNNCFSKLYNTLKTFEYTASGYVVWINEGRGALYLGHHRPNVKLSKYPYFCNKYIRQQYEIDEFPDAKPWKGTINAYELQQFKETNNDIQNIYNRSGLPFLMYLEYSNSSFLFTDSQIDSFVRALKLPTDESTTLETLKGWEAQIWNQNRKRNRLHLSYSTVDKLII